MYSRNTLMFTSVLPFKNKVLHPLSQNFENEKYRSILLNLLEDVHMCSLRKKEKHKRFQKEKRPWKISEREKAESFYSQKEKKKKAVWIFIPSSFTSMTCGWFQVTLKTEITKVLIWPALKKQTVYSYLKGGFSLPLERKGN